MMGIVAGIRARHCDEMLCQLQAFRSDRVAAVSTTEMTALSPDFPSQIARASSFIPGDPPQGG
jgi:hypothetical protein